MSYATEDGAKLWVARYSGPPEATDYAYSIAVGPDGSKVFVTGSSRSSTINFVYWDYATVAYAAAVAVSYDGSQIFVTGWSTGSGSSYDYATVAYRTSSCANGSDETGPVSGAIHNTVEPSSGPAAPYVHGINCDGAAAHGL